MITSALVYLIVGLINLILLPINAILSAGLPALNDMLNAVAGFIELGFSYIGWAISIAGIPPALILLIIAFYTFILTIPLLIWTVKLVISWYNTLKL